MNRFVEVFQSHRVTILILIFAVLITGLVISLIQASETIGVLCKAYCQNEYEGAHQGFSSSTTSCACYYQNTTIMNIDELKELWRNQ